MKKEIKLIIVDFHGIISKGSLKEVCEWIAKKYKMNFDQVYEIFYKKYFSLAAVKKISEKESIALAIKELNLDLKWDFVEKKVLSYQKLDKKAFKYFLNLQNEGFAVLLLSKNTPKRFNTLLNKWKIKESFKYVINTFDLNLPKASRETIDYILKKFKVNPNEVVMLDDQEENLVEAKKRGIKTIFYKNLAQAKKELEKIIKN